MTRWASYTVQAFESYQMSGLVIPQEARCRALWSPRRTDLVSVCAWGFRDLTPVQWQMDMNSFLSFGVTGRVTSNPLLNTTDKHEETTVSLSVCTWTGLSVQDYIWLNCWWSEQQLWFKGLVIRIQCYTNTVISSTWSVFSIILNSIAPWK